MIHPSWKTHIPLVKNGTGETLRKKVANMRKKAAIFPPDELVFRALDLAFDRVRVVILGQDPYHGEGQAHGLAFSVPQGIKAPPSLKNIFKEMARDLETPDSLNRSTDLSDWAKQGVLLLNVTLTVESGKPGSHADMGWSELTDQIIRELSLTTPHLVFLLWGSHAQAKAGLISGDTHLVLKAPHPSPLSAYRGFFGCGHFSKTNAFLTKHGYTPIAW